MTDNYGETIAKALATEGGHLFIGRGGFSLHYEAGWLSGYDCETVKAAAIAAGLPVIDSRMVDFGKVADLALRWSDDRGRQASRSAALARAVLCAARRGRRGLRARGRRGAERARLRRRGGGGLRAREPFGLFDGEEGEREALAHPSRSSGTWRRLF